MDRARRVERLRALAAQVELLPASPARDRMLSEFRSRAVDIDTGVAPRAILPLHDFAPPLVPDRPPRRDRPRRVAQIAPPTPAPPAESALLPAAETLHDPHGFDERLTLQEALRPSPPHHVRTHGDGAVAPWARGLRG